VLFEKKKQKSGIAFGGGGTRGFAHLGAIRVFQENDIDFDYVSGNSAGSIAGALYAAGIPWQDMYAFVEKFTDIYRPRKSTLLSYMSPELIEELADNFLKGMTFSDLKKPFSAVAVDLDSGVLDILDSGNVSKALSASCAVPGIFRPVKIGNKRYIDGGTLCSIPTRPVREMGADLVVGINLNADRGNGTESSRRLDVFVAAYNLSINVNSRLCTRYADIMLCPRLDGFARHSFKSIEEMISIGEKTAKNRLGEMKRLLG
jgi:NTE family protein